LLTFFCFEEKKKVYAFFCYFSCASKKSKEYKQKDKYKFTLIAYIYFIDSYISDRLTISVKYSIIKTYMQIESN